MTLNQLFTTMDSSKIDQNQSESVRLKIIRPVYQTLEINDEVAAYLNGCSAITCADQVSGLLDFLRLESKEHFLTIHLNNKNQILCIELVSIGSLSSSIVHPREVFKSALLSSAASIMLAHNHPSGNTTPSSEDIASTKRLVQAAELLGIRVLDHLILGDGYYSFCDHGLMEAGQ